MKLKRPSNYKTEKKKYLIIILYNLFIQILLTSFEKKNLVIFLNNTEIILNTKYRKNYSSIT